MAGRSIEFAGFRLELDPLTLVDATKRDVRVSRQALRVLEVLVCHAPGAVDRDTILKEAWPADVHVENGNIDTHVSTLRNKLPDDSITTLQARGYRFNLPCRRSWETPPRSEPRAEIFLPSFGAHLPSGPKQFQASSLIPLSLPTEQALDLDLSALLLADGLIIDSMVRDSIEERKDAYLGPMKETLDCLAGEGLLRVVDYGTIAANLKADVAARVDAAIKDPRRWLDAAREQWKAFREILPWLVERFGDKANPSIEYLHFGVFCVLDPSGDKFDEREAARLHKLLESQRTKFSAGETDAIREIVRPFVSHIVLARLLRHELGCPFVDWHDLDPYYREVERLTFEERERAVPINLEMVRGCRELFAVALPELRPRNAKQIVEFLRSRSAVASLREELRLVSREGKKLDRRWAEEIGTQAKQAQIADPNRQRVMSMHGVNGESASPGAEAEPPPDRFGWYYALLSGSEPKQEN